MPESAEDAGTAQSDGALRIVYRVVTPLGMAILAFAEFVDGAIPAAEVAFLAIGITGVFAAVHFGIDELDRRLNGESRGVPSIDEF